jgi:release factor glutamine methyltransferase
VSATVAGALALASAAGVDALDAQLLLAKCLDRPRTWLLAFEDASVAGGAYAAFLESVTRRAGGEPLAYLVGEKEFRGLMLHVNPAVLVPRPETEHLVQWGLELLSQQPADVAQRVIDLGTGSGAIALALKAAWPSAQVHATDTDEAALDVARGNARRLGLDVEFALGDWWRPTVHWPAFHLALCNPPYVAAGDTHLPALAHEPLQALTPGPSGLEALEAVVRGAPMRLQARGWLLLEHGFDQGPAVRAMLQSHGFTRVETRQDLAGLPRCTGGCRPV